jgi:hypothetical protein
MHCLLKQYHPYVVERHGKVSAQGTKRKTIVISEAVLKFELVHKTKLFNPSCI